MWDSALVNRGKVWDLQRLGRLGLSIQGLGSLPAKVKVSEFMVDLGDEALGIACLGSTVLELEGSGLGLRL